MTNEGNKIGSRMKSVLITGMGLMMVFFSLTACTTANYGSLKRSADVTQLFETQKILPNHDYYFYGFERIPYAIIGIHHDYQLQSKSWQYIKLTPVGLNQLMYRMDIVYLNPPRGAWILDPDGNRIGIWYSSELEVAVRMRQDNKVLVSPPKPPDLSGGP